MYVKYLRMKKYTLPAYFPMTSQVLKDVQYSSSLHSQEVLGWHVLDPPGKISLQTGFEGEAAQSTFS